MKRLSDILADKRIAKNISIEQAAKDTKLRVHILKKLENGEYLEVGSPTQVRGFLKIYANYLEIPTEDALAFYRREIDDTKGVKNSFEPIGSKVKPQPIRFTPKNIFTLIVLVFILTVTGYLWTQYQAFAGAPNLDVYAPKDGAIYKTTPVDIEGKVEEDSTLTLNGQTVPLNQTGYFKTKLDLSEGLNVLTFVAVNEVGKSTTIRKSVRFDVRAK